MASARAYQENSNLLRYLIIYTLTCNPGDVENCENSFILQKLRKACDLGIGSILSQLTFVLCNQSQYRSYVMGAAILTLASQLVLYAIRFQILQFDLLTNHH